MGNWKVGAQSGTNGVVERVPAERVESDGVLGEETGELGNWETVGSGTNHPLDQSPNLHPSQHSITRRPPCGHPLHHSVRAVRNLLLAATAFLAFAASASPARAELEVRVSTTSAGQYQPVEVTAWDPDGS